MAGRTPLIAGNWKMHLNHLEAVAHVQKLAQALSETRVAGVDVLVFPPFTDLRSVQTLVDGEHLTLRYGAQDVSAHPSGAYTGEVSAPMLAKLGVTHALVGHSERRQYHGEDEAICAAKVRAALTEKIVPVLCVGESLEVRSEGSHVEHTLAQVTGALDGLDETQAQQVIVAYEPVWAIGTGEVATADDAQEMAAAIRGRLAEMFPAVAATIRILYGGSVKADNAADVLAGVDVDGALVGGASLVVGDFVTIVRSVSPGS
jgi:triosephosphate isomerase (TIM)